MAHPQLGLVGLSYYQAHRHRYRMKPSSVAFLAIIALAVVTPAALLVYQAVTPTVTTKQASTGRFVASSTAAGGLFGSPVTTVQTDTMSVAVNGAFSASRGTALVARTTNKSGLELCAAATCLPVAGEWGGPGLKATQQAASAVDFEAYGLGSDTLVRWLGLGFILAFFALLILCSPKSPSDARP